MKSFRAMYGMIAIGLLLGLGTGARADEREAKEPVVEKAGEGKGADGDAEKKRETIAEQGAEEKETKKGPGKGEPAEKGTEPVAGEKETKEKPGQGEPAAGTPSGTQAKGKAQPRQKRRSERKKAAAPAGDKKAVKAGDKGGANARFVDRDGDGIRDGQEHRFRGRHRRGKRERRGGSHDQQMERHRHGADQASAARRRGR
jgi:hypothetical protein